MKKSDFDTVGCVRLIIVLAVGFVFVCVVVMGGDVRQVLDFASTPYPTAISGARQETANNATNNTSIVLQVATSAPFAPTPQPTATPAPTATPQPTATGQASPTPLWVYVVGTSEALERRIDALENAPIPQVERIGFVHYGTLGAGLLIGVAVWGLAMLARPSNHVGTPRIAPKQHITPQNVTVTQHTSPVTADNGMGTIDEWAIIRGQTRQKIASQYQRGELIVLFPSPAPYEFTALQKRQLQVLRASGVSKNDLKRALWGRGGSLSVPALNRALGD